MLEFISRLGASYDAERWCFADSRYYLCKKITRSYYPFAENGQSIVRHVRFDRGGKVIGIVCRPADDVEETSELFYVAGTAVPLYTVPGDAGVRRTALEPGTVARVADFSMMDDPKHALLWCKVQSLRNPEAEGWWP